MNFLPAVPTDPAQRRAFVEIWSREIRVIRRRPSFIIGMTMAALSALTIILTGGTAARVLVLLGIFGVAAVYDTVTRHYCGVLQEREGSVLSLGASDAKA
jgi:hypothetical protein